MYLSASLSIGLVEMFQNFDKKWGFLAQGTPEPLFVEATLVSSLVNQ